MFVIWNDQAKAYVGFNGIRSLLVSDRTRAFRYESIELAKQACGACERPLPLFL